MDGGWYEDVHIQLFLAVCILAALWASGIIDPVTVALLMGGAGALINAVHVQQLHKQIDQLERQLNRK